jgi:hypothetical protein
MGRRLPVQLCKVPLHLCTVPDPATSLADLEAFVADTLRTKGVDGSAPPSMDRLCADLTGAPPQRAARADVGGDGCLAPAVGGEWRVYIADDVLPERERWLVGHELGHYLHRTVLRGVQETERRCDIIGAMLVAPRAAVLRAVALEGHAVTRLATMLRVEVSLVVLRLGECVNRPVALIRPTPIVRGAAHDWPDLTSPRRTRCSHPIRVERGWGLMARRAQAVAGVIGTVLSAAA